jgi:hypothetical protein
MQSNNEGEMVRIVCVPITAAKYSLGIHYYNIKRCTTGWTTGVRFPAGTFPLRHRAQTGSGAHPVSYPVVPRLKRSEREADHSPPSCAEVKVWVELYLHSPNVFLAWYLVERRDNFTFTVVERLKLDYSLNAPWLIVRRNYSLSVQSRVMNLFQHTCQNYSKSS